MRRSLALLVLCLALAACAHMPRMLGGSGDVDLRLDGEQKHETAVPVGRSLVLDMRDPATSGYVFSGATFDPALLRLDSIEPFDANVRVRYRFTALAEGQCDIIIHIRRKEPGYRPDVFKFVSVTITK